MKRRIVPHPIGATALLSPSGRGGPAPVNPLGPAVPINPIRPGSPPANAAGDAANQATKAIADALGPGITASTQSIIGAGQILLGVVLVAVGLLLASGRGGRVARGAGRAGLFVATRGAVR